MVADRGIFVVADGMGGHAAGEVASEMAVRFVARELGSLKGLSDDQVADRMRTSIRAANGAIFQRTLTEHDKRGMGTTVTAIVLYDTRFLIGQVGDSRAYLYRDQKLMQLTKDHSYVQEQVDAGYLTPEQARSHPYSNVITRCVGANSDVMPDVYLGTVKPGDLFLLASDGLTGMLEDPQLAELLAGNRMPQEQVDDLITEANRHGGLDNITAIIVRIDSVDAAVGGSPPGTEPSAGPPEKTGAAARRDTARPGLGEGGGGPPLRRPRAGSRCRRASRAGGRPPALGPGPGSPGTAPPARDRRRARAGPPRARASRDRPTTTRGCRRAARWRRGRVAASPAGARGGRRPSPSRAAAAAR